MLAAIEWQALITDPIREMLTKIIGYLPTLLGALIILVVGWIIAKAIAKLVNKVLKTARFDTLADKSGISSIINKGGLQTTASALVSALVYWLVIIMVLVMVVNALGLPQASSVLETLFAYIPNVIAAVFVLVVAMFLASFVSGIVRTAAGNANLPKPEMFAGVSRWAIIVFGATVSLKELGIAPLLVTSTFNIVLGGVCLALALAFGLGGKDAAAHYLDKVIRKHDEKSKEHIYS
jgi:hypothetical protein